MEIILELKNYSLSRCFNGTINIFNNSNFI